MFKEHQRIVLTEDLASEGLEAGDVGTIIHVYGQGQAFEVEFFTLDGQTAVVAEVEATQARAVGRADITHARPMERRVG